MGLDAHWTFSVVTTRNAQGSIVGRQRLDHRSQPALIVEPAQFRFGIDFVLIPVIYGAGMILLLS